MYDSNEDGTLDSETFIILPTVGNTAERHLIIDCNLNQLNFTVRAVSGITLFTTIPLDCAISSLHRVSSTGKLMLNFTVSYSCTHVPTPQSSMLAIGRTFQLVCIGISLIPRPSGLGTRLALAYILRIRTLHTLYFAATIRRL